jgi:hypothetical protein
MGGVFGSGEGTGWRGLEDRWAFCVEKRKQKAESRKSGKQTDAERCYPDAYIGMDKIMWQDEGGTRDLSVLVLIQRDGLACRCEGSRRLLPLSLSAHIYICMYMYYI